MKYIISENRLTELMKNFLDSFLSSKIHYRHDSFIIVANDETDAGYPTDIDMEYDYDDGRLYIYQIFVENFMDVFGMNSSDDKMRNKARDIISKWFEDKFDVQVKYSES